MRLKVWLDTTGTTETVVAASSKKEAARLMGVSLYSFNMYASDLDDNHPIAQVALAQPGVVLERSNNRMRRENDDWSAR